MIGNRVHADRRSNASLPALYAQRHPQPRTPPMASVSRGTTLGITRRGGRRKKWKMQARGDPRENYPDCGKHTNSQRATRERQATSAKSPCLQRLRSGRQVYPGRHRRREKKQWKRLWISCRYRFDKRRQKPESRSRRAEKQICLCSGRAGETLPRLHGELQTRSKVQPRLKRTPAPYSHIYPVPLVRITRLCTSHGRTLDGTIILPVLEVSRHHPFG